MANKKKHRDHPRPIDDSMADRVQSPSQPAKGSLCQPILVAVFLFAVTWLVFGQTLRHEFVNYDDPSYVYENARIYGGLSWPEIARALTQSHARNWHPLTTISHMLDCELFGLRPGGHHFTNVLLHGTAAVLLFFLLLQMTAALWRSAFVAGLFAIHPLRVESVAWVAERKDVLSGVLFMLTVAAYVRFVRSRSTARYLLVVLLFVLGLMSKPMLVTLPFALLLLDYWPLDRFRGTRGQGAMRLLFVEKIPLLVLSAASCIITVLLQKTGGAQSDALPILWRVNDALVSAAIYIGQIFWPINLAPFYPHPENRLHSWQIILAGVFLLALTVTVLLRRRRNPYLVTGWFWYLVMLLPVIGIVPVGAQGWADRYTYLPHIGLYMAGTWLVSDYCARFRYQRALMGSCAAVSLIACAWVSWRQTAYWKNSETLWSHTLAVTHENHVAQNNLGELLFKRGEIDGALAHYEKALEIRSHRQSSRFDFLLALYHSNIASALRRQGRLDEAIAHGEKAVQLQPDYGPAYLNFGAILLEKGRTRDAIATLAKAVTVLPEYAEAHISLGTALLQAGNDQEAVAHYETALRFAPEAFPALNNLAWLYATSPNPSIRNGARSVALAEAAIRVSGAENPFLLHKLAAAQAASGNFDNAIAIARRASQLAADAGNAGLVAELQRNLANYRANTALTDLRRPE